MNNLIGESVSRHPAAVVEVRREFKRADRNVDGRIDYNEFCELLQGLEAGMNAHELRQGFHEVDTNKDGLIDQQEFIDWWTTD
jgi:Ca2+-binding EF-hand superfamily protein